MLLVRSQLLLMAGVSHCIRLHSQRHRLYSEIMLSKLFHQPGNRLLWQACIAVSIREHLSEIASQSISAMREAKVSKRRRAPEFASNSKAMNNAVDMFKYFGSK